MNRDWLEAELGGGRSIGDIAREVGLHPSTVSYWVKKYGLTSRHVRQYRSHGGIQEIELRALVDRGLSIRQIAAECGRSPTAVRHWLGVFELRTERARRVVRGQALRECRDHGLLLFQRDGGTGSLRCPRCAAARVSKRRRRMKAILVEEAGGACAVCGYDRYIGALQFHHLDPASKRFQVAGRGMTRAISILREEAEKCVLLCANCHAEVEAGLVSADTFRSSTQGEHGPG